jgi:hypothetical protein
MTIWYIFPVLVSYTEKNLSTQLSRVDLTYQFRPKFTANFWAGISSRNFSMVPFSVKFSRKHFFKLSAENLLCAEMFPLFLDGFFNQKLERFIESIPATGGSCPRGRP